MCVETLWLHCVRVVSVVLKVGAVEKSVDSAVLKFMATTSLEDQDKILVLREGHKESYVARNLEMVGEAEAG